MLPVLFISESTARAVMSRGAEGFAGIVLVHEFLPVRSDQYAAFAPHGLGDEEGARFRSFRAGG
jgi:hypothetical protein